MIIRFMEQAPCAADNAGIGYIGTDIVGTATGGSQSFASVPGSTYRSALYADIWLFTITYQDGTTEPVYCLEKGLRGPNDDLYQSTSMEQALPYATPEERQRLMQVLANGYPAVSPQQLFLCAGVDASAPPALTWEDAYAATQIGLWSVFNPPTNPEMDWQLLDLGTGQLHPKSARIAQTVAYLYEGANQEGSTTSETDQSLGSNCRTAQIGGANLIDCGSYINHPQCAKMLYGPLMVVSSVPFHLSMSPLCEQNCAPGFITLTDACGNQIQAPESGQEFYLAFPPNMPACCYQLVLEIERRTVTVITFKSLENTVQMQAIGATGRSGIRKESTSLCVCLVPPCKQPDPMCCCLCVPCQPCTWQPPQLCPSEPCKPCPGSPCMTCPSKPNMSCEPNMPCKPSMPCEPPAKKPSMRCIPGSGYRKVPARPKSKKDGRR